DRLLRATAHKVAAATPNTPHPTPSSIKPVRHALEDSLPALQKALESRSLKRAVGAESMSNAAPSMADLASAFASAADAAPSLPADAFDELSAALRQRSDP